MELHFLRPHWFVAIIPLFFLCWRLSKISLVENWRNFCDQHLLSFLLIVPNYSLKLPIALLGLGGLLAIFSLSGPSWQRQAQPIYRSTIGNIIILNLSPSMADSIGTTKKIDRARFKMIDYLARQKEGLTGLVVYTDEAHTIAPLTEDNRTIANFVPALDPSIMPTFNDDTRSGLKEAQKLFKQAGVNSGNILLITDKITNLSASKSIARALFDEGYRLYVYDISQQPGTNNDFKKLAEAGGGSVIALTPNNQDIDELSDKVKSTGSLNHLKKSNETGFFWQDNGRVILLLLLPLALVAFRRGYF